MFCCMLLYFHSSIAIILKGKRELVALLNLSSWCLVMVEHLFLAVPLGCLRFVIVVFSDHTHLLLLKSSLFLKWLCIIRILGGYLFLWHGTPILNCIFCIQSNLESTVLRVAVKMPFQHINYPNM